MCFGVLLSGHYYVMIHLLWKLYYIIGRGLGLLTLLMWKEPEIESPTPKTVTSISWYLLEELCCLFRFIYSIQNRERKCKNGPSPNKRGSASGCSRRGGGRGSGYKTLYRDLCENKPTPELWTLQAPELNL